MSKPLRWVGIMDVSIEQTGLFTAWHYVACHLQSHDTVVRSAARAKQWTQQRLRNYEIRVRIRPGTTIDAYRDEVTQRLIADICSVRMTRKQVVFNG